jgi:hypothetical protein
VLHPNDLLAWAMDNYAEDALRFGRLAVESVLREKIRALLKKHGDVNAETGDYQQVDLSDLYADFPKRTPARVSVLQEDGICIYKRLDHCTEEEALQHIARQNRLMRGIEKEVAEVEEYVEWRRTKKIPPETTPHEWREQMIAAGTAVASAKRRAK